MHPTYFADMKALVSSNIVLIGMPGSGKSTVGVILARHLLREFVDTDLLIQIREGVSLQQMVDQRGYQHLRRVEEQVILSLDCSGQVVATGGSAVYSDKAMRHLKQSGIVVYLDVPLEEIYRRVVDFDTRGVARRPDQSMEDLFLERSVLYRRYADITIGCTGVNQDQVCRAICERL